MPLLKAPPVWLQRSTTTAKADAAVAVGAAVDATVTIAATWRRARTASKQCRAQKPGKRKRPRARKPCAKTRPRCRGVLTRRTLQKPVMAVAVVAAATEGNAVVLATPSRRAAVATETTAQEEAAAPSTGDLFAAEPSAGAAAVQAAAETPPAAVEEASPPAPAAVQAPPYVLTIADLQNLAQASGLEWVNSDPEKIAIAQAAIAAAPRPVHVPRERPPAGAGGNPQGPGQHEAAL